MRITKILIGLVASALLASLSFADSKQEYDYWAKFPVGATVRLKTVTKMDAEKPGINTVTWKISAISEDDVSLEGESEVIVDGQKITVPESATIYKSSASDYEELGDESITVPGGTFKCRKTKRVQQAGKDTITLTTWWADGVPGGIVKSTTISSDGSFERIKELISFKMKK